MEAALTDKWTIWAIVDLGADGAAFFGDGGENDEYSSKEAKATGPGTLPALCTFGDGVSCRLLEVPRAWATS